MQFLCDVDSNYTGTINVGGVDIKSVEPRAYRSSIAFVPQIQYFQQGTIFSNIASTQSITKEEFSTFKELFCKSIFVKSKNSRPKNKISFEF